MKNTKKILLSILTPAAAMLTIAPVAIVATSCGTSPTITSVKITTTQTKIKVGKTIKLAAEVSGTGNFDKSVEWTIESGSEYATLEGDILTAGSTSGQTIRVKATAKGNKEKSATLDITTTDKTPINFVMSNCTYTTTATELDSSTSVTVIITRKTGYDWPNKITIEGCEASQAKEDPIITLTLSNPTATYDAVTITCNCVEHQMQVKFGDLTNVTNARVISPAIPKKGQDITIGYDIDSQYPEYTLWYGNYSTVTIGSEVYGLHSGYITYDRNNKRITISGEVVTGDDVVIKLTANSKVYPTEVNFTYGSYHQLEVGKKSQLYPTFTPLYTTERNLTYNVKDDYKDLVSVDQNGLVTALKEGYSNDNTVIKIQYNKSESESTSTYAFKPYIKNQITIGQENPAEFVGIKSSLLTIYGSIKNTTDLASLIIIDFSKLPEEYEKYLSQPWSIYIDKQPYFVSLTLDDKELIPNKDFQIHWYGDTVLGSTQAPNGRILKFSKNSKLKIKFKSKLNEYANVKLTTAVI